MNGLEFYNFLKVNLVPGQNLSPQGNKFKRWLRDTNLQFTIPKNNPKSIPRNIIIAAKDAHNIGVIINNSWLIKNGCN